MQRGRFLKLNTLYDKIFWNPLLACFCLGFVIYKHYTRYGNDVLSWNLSMMSIATYCILILWVFLCFYNIKTKGRFVRWVNVQWGIKDDPKSEE